MALKLFEFQETFLNNTFLMQLTQFEKSRFELEQILSLFSTEKTIMTYIRVWTTFIDS